MASTATKKALSALTGITAGIAIGTLSAIAPAAAFDFEENRFTANVPYGMDSSVELNQPMYPSFRDDNGNRVIANGDLTASGGGTHTSGVGFTSTSGGNGNCNGVSCGSNSAQAIGNQINVVTTGSYNTVVINAEQINNGNQQATVTNNVQ
jgi:holdfast attachment protein HfaA